eukprot:11551356-Prorocentrum_lima.AAC.1
MVGELITGRTVRCMLAGKLCPEHPIRRGIGMGSPISPLLWCLAYDPILRAVQDAAGVHTP